MSREANNDNACAHVCAPRHTHAHKLKTHRRDAHKCAHRCNTRGCSLDKEEKRRNRKREEKEGTRKRRGLPGIHGDLMRLMVEIVGANVSLYFGSAVAQLLSPRTCLYCVSLRVSLSFSYTGARTHAATTHSPHRFGWTRRRTRGISTSPHWVGWIDTRHTPAGNTPQEYVRKGEQMKRQQEKKGKEAKERRETERRRGEKGGQGRKVVYLVACVLCACKRRCFSLVQTLDSVC